VNFNQIVRSYSKKSFLLGLDLLFVLAALPAALFVRLEPKAAIDAVNSLTIQSFAIVFISFMFSFLSFKTYRTIVRLANLHTALRVGAAVFVGSLVSFLLTNYVIGTPTLPRSTFLIQMLLVAPLCILLRFSFRILDRIANGRSGDVSTLIYGAGLMTDRILPILMRRSNEFRIRGIIDDNPAKRGSEVQGIRVIGNLADVPALISKYQIELVILSMPSVPGQRIREIIDTLLNHGVKVKILPSPMDFSNGVASEEVRDLNIDDLLRRPPRNIDRAAIEKSLSGKCVLVTGGGGSIGSELVRQIASMGPSRLIVNDASEFALYAILEEMKRIHPDLHLRAHLGNLAEQCVCEQLFHSDSIDVVFHACAYKHVPLVEENVCSAVINNIRSACNVFDQSVATKVSRIILISSDKAVRPTNVMGATKRVCELLSLWYAQNQTGEMRCAFSAVRFGNVLGSSGSVVPKFLDQIRSGGPVTITHPDITRYFMLIPEAVSLVLQASVANASGAIFVLNMGDPVKVKEMAEDLIRLMGKTPGSDIKIIYTGLRPGEKLFEELSLESEHIEAVTEDFFKLVRTGAPASDFIREVRSLLSFADSGDVEMTKTSLFRISQAHETSIHPQDNANASLDGATTSSSALATAKRLQECYDFDGLRVLEK
jgi:FlaA1/EpsC-like NDP-sugar epimerase